MTAQNVQASLKVYWQLGCSSCLKAKDFLLAYGVDFESFNVLKHEMGFRDVDRMAGGFFAKEWTLWPKTKTSTSPP